MPRTAKHVSHCELAVADSSRRKWGPTCAGKHDLEQLFSNLSSTLGGDGGQEAQELQAIALAHDDQVQAPVCQVPKRRQALHREPD